MPHDLPGVRCREHVPSLPQHLIERYTFEKSPRFHADRPYLPCIRSICQIRS